MRSELMKAAMFLLSLIALSAVACSSLGIVEYYGSGCPHCARGDATLDAMTDSYGLQIEKKEIYYDAANRQEMFGAYGRFGLDPGQSGVPTLLLDNRSLIIGEVSAERFAGIFDAHMANGSLSGIYTENSFSQIEELDPTTTLTIWVLLGAAVADSINPCTIAVMAMLLGVILTTEGRKKVLMAAFTFIGVIFVSYYLMGLGLLQTITNAELTNTFFTIVTIGALVLAVMEIKAYFRYKPGFASIEIPLFLRPHLRKAMSKATSLPGVAFAALLCSLFLLPCSSGPYLMVLSMLAKSVTLNGLFYLFAYNMVFVLPMVVIALMIYMGKTTVEDVGEFRETHIKNLHLISGLLFLVLFLLLLNQMLSIV